MSHVFLIYPMICCNKCLSCLLYFFSRVLLLVIFYLVLQIRNEKARRYLASMPKKQPIPFSKKFPNADPLGLNLLERLLAFDPKDRPAAEEVVLQLPR